MATKPSKTVKAEKSHAKKTAKNVSAKKPTRPDKARKTATAAFKQPSARRLHLQGLEALADLALTLPMKVQPAKVGKQGIANMGTMSPAEAVIWALNRAVGPPFGPSDSVSSLGITSAGQWEALANDLHTARNSYTLNGAETRSKLPPTPGGDTVSALVAVVAGNS